METEAGRTGGKSLSPKWTLDPVTPARLFQILQLRGTVHQRSILGVGQPPSPLEPPLLLLPRGSTTSTSTSTPSTPNPAATLIYLAARYDGAKFSLGSLGRWPDLEILRWCSNAL